MRSNRLKLLSGALGVSLMLVGSSPVFAQEEMAPTMPNGDEGTALQEHQFVHTATAAFNTEAAGAYSHPGDKSSTSGHGHATDSSNNWMGDVAEGLSNQPMTDDNNNDDTTANADDAGI